MIATRSSWSKTKHGWRRADSDGSACAIVPASSSTHPYLWALYAQFASQPARCGYAKTLDEALAAADDAAVAEWGERGFA